jgi:uncharacterized repeat protein (TIGR01451 family)
MKCLQNNRIRLPEPETSTEKLTVYQIVCDLIWFCVIIFLIVNVACESDLGGPSFNIPANEIFHENIQLTCSDPVINIQIQACTDIDNPCASGWNQAPDELFKEDHPVIYPENRTDVNGTLTGRKLCYPSNVQLLNETFGYDYSYSNEVSCNPNICPAGGGYKTKKTKYIGSGTYTVNTYGVGNIPPTANAGPDQTVIVSSLVQLDGSGSSDAENDPLTYYWAVTSFPGTSPPSLSYPNDVNPTFIADELGTYTIELIVNDGTSDSIPDSVLIQTTEVVADLAITKTAFPDPVNVNDQLKYTLDITNNGPDKALDVVVRDELPHLPSGAPIAFESVSVSPPGPTCDYLSPFVECNLGNIEVGLGYTIFIEVRPAEKTTGEVPPYLTNRAQVTHRGILDGTLTVDPDPNPTNDEAIVETVVLPATGADLMISKTDNPDPVWVDTILTYILQVTNHGPDLAPDVVVKDILPNLPSGTPIELYNIYTIPSGLCTVAGSQVECAIGNVPVGTAAPITIEVIPREATAPTEPPLENIAQVTMKGVLDGTLPPDFDPDPLNDEVRIETIVLPPTGADLGISKSDDPDPVIVNNLLTYTLDIMNYGPDTAVDVKVKDVLPPMPSGAPMTYLYATPANVCTEAGGIVECFLGDLAASSIPFTIKLYVRPTEATTTGANQPLENKAEVTTQLAIDGTNLDFNPTNDNAAIETVVLPSSGLNTPPVAVDDPNYRVNEDTPLFIFDPP